jgi:hypothetical protein
MMTRILSALRRAAKLPFTQVVMGSWSLVIVLRAMEVGAMAVVKEVLDLLGSHNMFQSFLRFW